MRPVTNVSYDFSEHVVLITGGARGQGRAHALEFAKAGADIVIGDIAEPIPTLPYDMATAEQLKETAAEVEALGVRCVPVICDVRDAGQVDAMVEKAIDQLGAIDVLINNAGGDSLPTVAEMSETAWDDVVDTVLKGAFLCSKAVSRHMVERRKGSIICVGSVGSLTGMPRQAHYCAAKHGLVGFARSLAIELAESRITVNVVCPGGVDTPMLDGLLASPNGDWLETLPEVVGRTNLIEPEGVLDETEVASAILWLASDAARMVTGTCLTVDAGYSIK